MAVMSDVSTTTAGGSRQHSHVAEANFENFEPEMFRYSSREDAHTSQVIHYTKGKIEHVARC